MLVCWLNINALFPDEEPYVKTSRSLKGAYDSDVVIPV